MQDRPAVSTSHADEPAPDVDLDRRLLEYRDLVERLLEEMPAGFVSVDDGLRVTYVNRAAEAMWELGRENVVGRGIWELFPEAATPEITEAVTRLVETGEPIQFEQFFDRHRKWIQVFAFHSSSGLSAFFLDVTARRLAELEREAAEARYRDIVEEVPAITYQDDAFDGRGGVIFVSSQSKEILGYSPEEWLLNANLWREIVHPDDLDAVAAEDTRCRKLGIPFEAEYRMIARDGRVVWFHDRATPVLDETGRPTLMHGVLVDITAHREAQEQIRRKDSILAAVGFAAERLLNVERWEDVIHEVLARLGVASGVDRADVFEIAARDDEVLAWSRAEWFDEGMEPVHDRVQGTPIPWFRDWLPTLETGRAFVARNESAGPGPFRFPDALGFSSSTVAPLIVGSRLWGILSLGDTTKERTWSGPELEAVRGAAATIAAAMARQRTERDLRESEERFRRLAEGAPDIIFRLRLGPEPRVEYVSPAIETVLGFTPEEVVRDRDVMFRLVHPDDLPVLERILTEGRVEQGQVLRCLHPDGRTIWIEVRATRVFDEAGRLVALEGIARDASDRIRGEERLRESFDALRRSSEERRQLLARLVRAQEEERQRVANDIHDDSIQIMTAVGMRLALLRGHGPGAGFDETLETAEQTVALAIQRLRRLLFELHPLSLDSSGLGAAIGDHLRKMADEGGPAFSVQDRLEHEPPTESRTILYRIAQEALTNVRKHARAERVRVLIQPEDDGVRVTVDDNGVGFDPHAPRDDAGHVGLPSMQERAQLAGGWCKIRSTPGGGTTVTFWVPEIVATPRTNGRSPEGDDAT